MSSIHDPGHNHTTGPDAETTRPMKTCPICGEQTQALPDHIAGEHS